MNPPHQRESRTSREAPIHIEESVLEDLHERLRRARRPSPPVRPGWADGVDRSTIDRFLRDWAVHSWRDSERHLNDRYRHFWTTTDGVSLHTAVADGPADRPPLVALHGWPSTFLQMLPLADRIRAHPLGRTVIAPSLPGFGFSSAPRDPGWDLARTARAVHDVITRGLGHPRYLVRGTDYGLGVALHLGALFPEQVLGVHIGGTHLAAPPDEQLPADLNDAEREFVRQARRWYEDEAGYVAQQSTKPETEAVALADSPAGTLALVLEKYRGWCATPDDLTRSIPSRTVLDTVTVLWATGSIASSLRLYREDRLGAPVPRSRAAVSVNQPTDEEYVVPESWWRRLQPVTRHTMLPGAGHFPEWEAPDALAADLLAFVADLDIDDAGTRGR